MGYIPEIVNIPSKPTPEGFKIQVLVNGGYILDFIWHAKYDKALWEMPRWTPQWAGYIGRT